MSLPLLPAERTQYSALIDALFEKVDLQTVTARQIRKALSAQLGKDISSQKEALQALIIDRFDVAARDISIGSDGPTASIPETKNNHREDGSGIEKNAPKRKLKISPQNSYNNIERNSATKAKRLKAPKSSTLKEEDRDEKYTSTLQTEEYSGTRAARGTAKDKKIKRAAINKNSSTKRNLKKARAINNNDNDLENVGTKTHVEEEGQKKGGFHKQYCLSEPLAELLGESRLSRPQVVKNIWAYIKAKDLQDPNDRRQIICDERMRLVFKQDRVHMFTMNKIIGNQLYDIEDD